MEKYKEYEEYFNKIIFAGECPRDKRNGKGKEYDTFGWLLFDGVMWMEWDGKEKNMHNIQMVN